MTIKGGLYNNTPPG